MARHVKMWGGGRHLLSGAEVTSVWLLVERVQSLGLWPLKQDKKKINSFNARHKGADGLGIR